MKKEQKEKVIKAAHKGPLPPNVKIGLGAKVVAAPDAYWVQAWVCVPLDAVK